MQVCATLLKLAKAQPETGLINFDQLEPSVRTAGNEHSCSAEVSRAVLTFEHGVRRKELLNSSDQTICE